ncbi:TPA: SsrA-binding protein SmpB [Candidatus Poribacteria bacterium]|nr:SsrA-binding protein SmpB [Candidatus Poribacteria bacterium]
MKWNKVESANSKVVTVNRKARHDYHLMERHEAGISLTGTEVKSIRNGGFTLTDSYIRLEGGEAFLVDAHIGLYNHSTVENHAPKRVRKLLLHRKEIRKLDGKTRTSGITIVPTKAYFDKGKVKVEIALARGKRDYDKRQDLKKQTDQRMIRDYIKN